jgi:hypothetical protein
MPGSLGTSVQSIVQNLQHQRQQQQQQQQQQVVNNAHQVVHPKPVKPQNVRVLFSSIYKILTCFLYVTQVFDCFSSMLGDSQSNY